MKYIAILLCAAAMLYAQNKPHIGYAFPAGAQRGSTVTVLIGGQYLEGASNVYISGGEVNAEIVSYTKEMDRRMINGLTNSRASLEAKLAGDVEGDERERLEKQLARVMTQLSYQEQPPEDKEMQKYMKNIEKKKQPNVQLTELVRVTVTIPESAVTGRRELRLITPIGVTDPLAFYIGTNKEFQEGEPTDVGYTPMRISSLPAVINGQILPGERDRYIFSARKGQSLSIIVQARALIPYLADAVPGWFQSVITLYNAAGKEIAYADDFLGNPDPVLSVTIPEDGDYTLVIHDSIFRGREDFVYRITIGDLPYISGIYPLGGAVKGETKVTLYGLNLKSKEAVIRTAGEEPGSVRLDNQPGFALSPVLFHGDNVTEIAETEVNNTRSNAQKISLPAVINGGIQVPGDIDVYAYTAAAGEQFIAEVFARRLGSPLDAHLKVVDARGTLIAANDDTPDRSAGLIAHQADSYISCTLSNAGVYYLMIKDTQAKGSAQHGYRLRVSHPNPDFKVSVSPSSANIQRGGTYAFTATIQRIDGFNGPVSLYLDNDDDGITLNGGEIRSQAESVRITISVSPDQKETYATPAIYGKAMILGQEVRHRAVAAEDMMQAFAYRHLVPTEDMILTMLQRTRIALQADVAAAVSIPVERQISIPIIPMHNSVSDEKLREMDLIAELDSPLPGVSVLPVDDDVYGNPCIVLKAETNAKIGPQPNLVFKLYTSGQGKDKKKSDKKILLCTMPAIQCDVIR